MQSVALSSQVPDITQEFQHVAYKVAKNVANHAIFCGASIG